MADAHGGHAKPAHGGGGGGGPSFNTNVNGNTVMGLLALATVVYLANMMIHSEPAIIAVSSAITLGVIYGFYRLIRWAWKLSQKPADKPEARRDWSGVIIAAAVLGGLGYFIFFVYIPDLQRAGFL
jgi:hypothetical protein